MICSIWGEKSFCEFKSQTNIRTTRRKICYPYFGDYSKGGIVSFLLSKGFNLNEKLLTDHLLVDVIYHDYLFKDDNLRIDLSNIKHLVKNKIAVWKLIFQNNDLEIKQRKSIKIMLKIALTSDFCQSFYSLLLQIFEFNITELFIGIHIGWINSAPKDVKIELKEKILSLSSLHHLTCGRKNRDSFQGFYNLPARGGVKTLSKHLDRLLFKKPKVKDDHVLNYMRFAESPVSFYIYPEPNLI